MADVTRDFGEIARSQAEKLGKEQKRQETRPDAFVREAYRLYEQMREVESYLARIRKAYLSHATDKSPRMAGSPFGSTGNLQQGEIQHLTDKERDEIDYEVKKSIREAAKRIKEMEEMEQTRRARASAGSGGILGRFLRDPDEEARSDLLASHRSSMTWFLSKRLHAISKRHSDQQIARFSREEERRKAAHPSAATTGPRYAYDQDAPSDGVPLETLLSPEQLQLFESENEQMVKEFESTLDQVRYSGRSLVASVLTAQRDAAQVGRDCGTFQRVAAASHGTNRPHRPPVRGGHVHDGDRGKGQYGSRQSEEAAEGDDQIYRWLVITHVLCPVVSRLLQLKSMCENKRMTW